MKELIIELPETLVDDDMPYRILANNKLQINLAFYDRADDPALDVRNTESIVFPLPEPKGMWMVKAIVGTQLILLDV